MEENITQGQEEVVEPSFEENYEDIKFAEFDKKSPMLGGGHADDNEESPVDWGDDDGEEENDVKDEPLGGETEVAYKTLKVGNSEYQLKSEAELESLALRALQFGETETRLQPYAGVIEAIEKDPGLAGAVADAIRSYQTGIPLQRPEAQGADPVDPNKEPEQGEYEDYDDYEKRLNQWREDRNQRLIDQKIQSHFRQMQEQARISQVQAANAQIINYVNADPDKDAVLAVIADPKFPEGLRRAMDYDGPTFMSVYDSIRRQQGKQAYFGAPPIWGNVPQTGTGPEQGRTVPPARQAPFAESGRGAFQQGTKGGVDKKLPDFKTMNDEEFRKWKESFMLSRQGL